MEFLLNNKLIRSRATIFRIEVGKNKYRPKFKTENIQQALLLYQGINVANGYKKRLRLGNKTLLREFTV